MLSVSDTVPAGYRLAYEIGQKVAGDFSLAHNMSGRFHISRHNDQNWGLLTVPNALVLGVHQAMDEPGIELPPDSTSSKLNAHITVMRPEEIEVIGGPDKLRHDRGKMFTYTIGRLVSMVPRGWKEMSKVWALRVISPALQTLRRSYGLTSKPKDNKFDFHITVAVRRKNVLGANEVVKAAVDICPGCGVQLSKEAREDDSIAALPHRFEESNMSRAAKARPNDRWCQICAREIGTHG